MSSNRDKQVNITPSFRWKLTLALIVILEIPFLFMELTDFSWMASPINYLLPAAIIVLIVRFVVSLPSNQEISRFANLLFGVLLSSTFVFATLATFINVLVYGDDQNLACKKFTPIQELYTPDKSKKLIICDSLGPSGIWNVQIHYSSLPFIKRELVIEKLRDANNGMRNYLKSEWIDNNTLYTQNPENLSQDQIIKFNIWSPQINIPESILFVSINLFFVLLVALLLLASKLRINGGAPYREKLSLWGWINPNSGIKVTMLYCPTSLKEIELIAANDYSHWPSHLPEGFIFYPVTNKAHAQEIAKNWSIKKHETSLVTRFLVKKSFMDKYQADKIGRLYRPVPAEDLDELNANIVGQIEVIGEYI